MKAIVQFTNKITLEIEEQDEMETLHKAIALSSPHKACICGNKSDFYFTTNKAKSKEGKGPFIYINYKCPKCGARSGLGRYEAGGYFFRNFEKYVPKSEREPEEEERG